MNTILVTGGAGFIGSALVRHLAEVMPQANVVVLDKLTYAGNRENLAGVPHTFHQGSVCDKKLVQSVFSTHRPRWVFHLAAESHVDRSIEDPSPFIETNVVGTMTMLEAAKQAKLSLPDDFRFVNVSTDEVYGSTEGAAFTEESPFSPSSPYAVSKASADLLGHAYHWTYHVPVVTVRSANNYGPRQYPEKLVPVIIQTALARKPIPVYGDGQHVRDWLFVEDFCRGLVAAAEKAMPGTAYNFGANQHLTTLEMVRAVCAELDKRRPRGKGSNYADLVFRAGDRPGHDRRYSVDWSRARTHLGWNPMMPFHEGIAQTVDWYLERSSA